MIDVKSVYISYNDSDDIYIKSFGIEDDFKKAHWGRGSRNEVILHYVLSGEGYFNGELIKSGEGFFILPGQMHEYHSSDTNPWSYFWVILNGKRAQTLCEECVKPDKYGKFIYDFKSELKTFALEFLSSPKRISSIKALGVFMLLMSYHEEDELLRGNKYVNEAKKYMEHNIFRNISIVEIANNLHISDRYLYNLFVENEGVSPKKYLSNLRIESACKLLKNSEHSITEIAISVGFKDVLTFSRFFSKSMGISPTIYRKSFLK